MNNFNPPSGAGRYSSKKQGRSFKSGSPVHIYQRSYDWGVIFYDDVHILAHFTLLCVLARKYNVRILALTYMLNHYHLLACFETQDAMERFMNELTSQFARMYNRYMGRSGTLYFKHFGSAVKYGNKAVITAYNYIVNNAVEKGIVGRAVDYKWDFLKYCSSSGYLSVPIHRRESSGQLWMLSKMVNTAEKEGHSLTLEQLTSIKSDISEKEWKALVDHIIIKFNVIDYKRMSTYFKSEEEMLSAPDYNTGSEYEITELGDSMAHRPYYQMLKMVKMNMPLYRWRPWAMNQDELLLWANRLLRCIGVSRVHLEGFLHLNSQKAE